MKSIIILLLTCLSMWSCKTNHIEKKCQPKIDAFFTKMEQNHPMESIKELLALNENIDISDSLSQDLIQKFEYINTHAGKFVDRKILVKRSIKDDVIIFSYLVKYEKMFYRFNFIFYDNGKKCTLHKFVLDDVMTIELEELTKLYMNNNL